MPQPILSTILLAAGNSTRLGRSKQLLPIGAKTLLEHTVQCVLEAEISRVMVVLGANASAHKEVINRLPVATTINQTWQFGMGNSLRTGIEQALYEWPQSEGILVLVCDQPLITPKYLKKLIAAWLAHRPKAVASYYGQVVGVPVLFDKALFADIKTIGDNVGARQLLRGLNQQEIIAIDFPEGALDIDTQADYQQYQSR